MFWLYQFLRRASSRARRRGHRCHKVIQSGGEDIFESLRHGYVDEEDKMWLHFISWRVIENPLSDGCDDKGLQLKYTFMCCSWAERYFGRCVIGVAILWQVLCANEGCATRNTF